MRVTISLYCLLMTIASLSQEVKLILPVGHTDAVWSATFSTNGKYVATASSDNTAKIWETATGKLAHDLTGHTREVTSATFSPDGKYMATASYDVTAKIWETATGRLVHDLTGHSEPLESATFSPDGKFLATASKDHTAKIWETATGKLVHDLTGHTNAISSATFSPDGKYVATASFDQTAKIWETATGKLARDLTGHTDGLHSANFSPDGKFVVTASFNNRAKIWETATGKLVHDLTGHAGGVESATFSPDGKYVVTASWDKTAKIWETATGKLVHDLTGHTDGLHSATFRPDGKYVATASNDNTAKIWETATGKLVHDLTGHADLDGPLKGLVSVTFSFDGKYVVTASYDNTAKIWETVSGKLLQDLTGHTKAVISATFSPVGKYMVTASDDNIARIWETATGRLVHDLTGHTKHLTSSTFSPDEKYVTTASWDETAKIWETATGKLAHDLTGHTDAVSSATFSPDGKYMATASYDVTAKIWETATGRLVHDLTGHSEPLESATFSPDGKFLATASMDHTAKIWETATGKLVHDLTEHTNAVSSATFSPDGKYVATASFDQTAKIWESATGKLVHDLTEHTLAVISATFSPDGKYLVTASWDKTAKIWETATGKLLHDLTGHTDFVSSATFSPDGKYVATASRNKTAKIWETATGNQLKTISGLILDINALWTRIITAENSKLLLYDMKADVELLSWVAVDATDWVVTHPSGLFDASPEAMDKLYFVQGLDRIQFNQLKDRYYEPRLWKKVMNNEPLRNVVGFKSIDLPPDIQVGQVDEKGYLPITLTNRGGGIGEVNVFVNGKEIIKDARHANVNADAPNTSLKVFVGKHKSIVKGQENLIAVKAWNKDHWVQSRGHIVSYQSKEIESYKPAVHILTCGVSDYTGTEIDLKYAAKDANDMGTALQLGAKKLFGAERSNVYNLTTTQAKESYPIKVNILKAFEKISSTAHPLDIFVMYVSGHGINYGGQDGDWHYLTQEAYTGSASAYNDPAIRAQTTISSNELVELFKKVPALKQVLILDACASGKVVDNLMAQKDIESSTLRALDRMRDRTGMHIITGCTADAVSYEASKYGQGVLTYSLLEGIRGAALREDQYVDVNKLFQYAQDRVPQLAEGIGGIQSPQVFSPQGSQSFDIGLLGELEKKEIPIAKIRPVFIRSTFIDDDQLEDALQLGKKIDDALAEAASKGLNSTIIFVDVREYPEGCKLSGRYRQENGIIKLKLRKKCEGIDETIDIDGKTVDEIKEKVFSKLN